MLPKYFLFFLFLTSFQLGAQDLKSPVEGVNIISVNSFSESGGHQFNAQAILKQSPEYKKQVVDFKNCKSNHLKLSKDCGFMISQDSIALLNCKKIADNQYKVCDSLSKINSEFERIANNTCGHLQSTNMYSDVLFDAIRFFEEGEINKTLDVLSTRSLNEIAEKKIINNEQVTEIEILQKMNADNFFFKAMIAEMLLNSRFSQDSIAYFYQQSIKYNENFYNLSEYAQFLKRTKKLDQSIIYFKKSIEKDGSNGEKAIMLNNVSEVYMMQNDGINATITLEQSLDLFKEMYKSEPVRHRDFVLGTQTNLANLYAAQKNYTKAESLLIDLLEFTKNDKRNYNLTSNIYILNALMGLTTFYANWKDSIPDRALRIPVMEKSCAVFGEMSKLQKNKPVFLAAEAVSYGTLAWSYLLAKRYADAESICEKGLLIDPSQVWLNTYLAHSKLLQGKYEEARVIYELYKDDMNQDKTYKVTYLKDFNTLEKAGIIHSGFNKIRKLLN
jgi:tetratricopeptide (TPR) repeat protein